MDNNLLNNPIIQDRQFSRDTVVATYISLGVRNSLRARKSDMIEQIMSYRREEHWVAHQYYDTHVYSYKIQCRSTLDVLPISLINQRLRS